MSGDGFELHRYGRVIGCKAQCGGLKDKYTALYKPALLFFFLCMIVISKNIYQLTQHLTRKAVYNHLEFYHPFHVVISRRFFAVSICVCWILNLITKVKRCSRFVFFTLFLRPSTTDVEHLYIPLWFLMQDST